MPGEQRTDRRLKNLLSRPEPVGGFIRLYDEDARDIDSVLFKRRSNQCMRSTEDDDHAPGIRQSLQSGQQQPKLTTSRLRPEQLRETECWPAAGGKLRCERFVAGWDDSGRPSPERIAAPDSVRKGLRKCEHFLAPLRRSGDCSGWENGHVGLVRIL